MKKVINKQAMLNLTKDFKFIWKIAVLLLYAVVINSQIIAQSGNRYRAQIYDSNIAHSEFENINLYNGHLTFNLPLISNQARGDLTYRPSVSINTMWKTGWTNYQNPNGNFNQSYAHHDLLTNNINLSLGIIYAETGGEGLFCNAQQTITGYNKTHTRLIFQAPDGTKIGLKDTQNNGQVVHHSGCAATFTSRGTVFVGEDDSSITFVSDTTIYDGKSDQEQGYPINITGTLYFKNGTKYKFDANGRVTITDKNGNTLTDADTISGQGYTVTDNAGRQVKWASIVGDIYDPTTISSSIKYNGVAGQIREEKIHYNWLHNALRSDYQQTAKHCSELFAYQMGCLISVYPNDDLIDPYVISSIDLPNGRFYKFYYNHFGELARIEFPDGGAVEYDHFQIRPMVAGAYNNIVHRGLKEKRTYPNGGTGNNYEIKTVYDYNYTNYGVTTETVTDNSGNLKAKVKHYFHGEPYQGLGPGGQWGTYFPFMMPFEGKKFKTEIYNNSGSGETISQTIDYDWKSGNGLIAPNLISSPRIEQIKTTLNDTNQVSKKDFNYDQFNNQTDVWEYDFGDGQPGSLLRRTHTDYLTINPVNNNLDYTVPGIHLRDLPSQVWLSPNGDENNKSSLTKFEYDDYSTNSHRAALLTRADVSGHDSISYNTNYKSRGNLTSVTTYGNASSQTEAITSYSQYDILGNVVKRIDAKGYSTTINYDDNFGAASGEARTPSVSPPSGKNTFAFITSVTNSLNWTAYNQYDYYSGSLVDGEDVNGIVSSISYNDPLDRPTQIIKANNIANFKQQSSIDYDNNNGGHKIITTSDLNEFGDNKLKQEELFDGFRRTIETRTYESDGGFVAIKSVPFVMTQDPENANIWRAASKTSNPYRPGKGEQPIYTTALADYLGRNIKVITPDGMIVRTEYAGNAITVTDQASKQRRTITNALAQIVKVHEPVDTFNTDGIWLSATLGTVANPAQETSYEYDVLGNLKKVMQGGQQRNFVYDGLSRLKEAQNPESGTINYKYDENGNLKAKLDARGIKTIYEYDKLNRVEKRCYKQMPVSVFGITTTCELATQAATATQEVVISNSPDVSYTYDNLLNAKGKITKVTNGISTTEYTLFDEVGRLKAHKQTTDGTAYTTGYAYNRAGMLTEETYPSTRVVKNVLDSVGYLSAVQSKENSFSVELNYARHFSYTAAGAISSMQLGNGNWESTKFNNRLQPTQIGLGMTQNQKNLLKLDYEYGDLNGDGTVLPNSNNGNVAKQTITVPGAGQNGFKAEQLYDYDSLNRIYYATEKLTPTGQTSFTGYWHQRFQYDRFGNRTFIETATTTLGKNCGNAPNLSVCAADVPLVNPAANIADNRLNGYDYDAAGNMIGDLQSRKYTYDGENKQVKVENVNQNGASVVGQYSYDGDGRRVKKYVPSTGETTIFVYDAMGKLVAEYSTIVATGSSAKVSYLTNDHLGSLRTITDQNGNVTSRRDFLPFGEEIVVAAPSTTGRNGHPQYVGDNTRQKFTGYERDGESGLDFAQARYYGGSYGRFSSPDPLMASARRSNPQTFNRYSYVTNNPLNLIDPLGLDGCDPRSRKDCVADRFKKGTQAQAEANPIAVLNISASDEPPLYLSSSASPEPSPSTPSSSDTVSSNILTRTLQTGGGMFAGAATTTITGGGDPADVIGGLIMGGLITAAATQNHTTTAIGETTTTTTADRRQNESFTMLYHGSINDATQIRATGLDPSKGSTFVSRDLAAAANAISPARYEVSQGLATDPGIISSRIPTSLFNQHFVLHERPYSGFGGRITSTEIVMRTPQQFQIFNANIVR